MSSWNGMRIDLSGSKAKITPAQTRDIGLKIKLDLDIASDVMIAESWETDGGFSKDCSSFITKLYEAKLLRLRNAKWYELEVTTDEVFAVCQEVLMNVLLDIYQSIDCYEEKEQQDMNRYAKKVRKFIQNNSQLLQLEEG